MGLLGPRPMYEEEAKLELWAAIKRGSRCACLLRRQTSRNHNQRRKVHFLAFVQQSDTSVDFDCMIRAGMRSGRRGSFFLLSRPSE